MKVKFALVYLLAGLAFLGASLWLLLSGGKNAKAARAKYKMGGIMLTAWSIITAASCSGGPPQVSCYEPAEPPRVTCYDVAMPNNTLNVSAKGTSENKFKPGDEMTISISLPSTDKYILRIHAGDHKSPVFQEISLELPQKEDKVNFTRKLGATDYRGPAIVELFSIVKNDDGQETEIQSDSVLIHIDG